MPRLPPAFSITMSTASPRPRRTWLRGACRCDSPFSRRPRAGAQEIDMATADIDQVSEAPEPKPAASREPQVNKLFRMVMKHEGSDLHLKVGLPPMMRLKGEIRQMQYPPLTQEDMERLLYPIMTERQRR